MLHFIFIIIKCIKARKLVFPFIRNDLKPVKYYQFPLGGGEGQFGPHFQLPSNCFYNERAGFIKFFDFSQNGPRVLDNIYEKFFPLTYKILSQYALNISKHISYLAYKFCSICYNSNSIVIKALPDINDMHYS